MDTLLSNDYRHISMPDGVLTFSHEATGKDIAAAFARGALSLGGKFHNGNLPVVVTRAIAGLTGQAIE